MKNGKRVLYVDDDETKRLGLVATLNMMDFDSEGAPDIATARDIVKQKGSKIDVMVLDMELDPKDPSVTGAALGIEVREAIGKWPPEFMILSAFNLERYYEAALKLDVGVYLVKGQVDDEDIVRHIRSLCLRHALSFERAEIAKKIGDIAGSSLNSSEAVSSFCRELLSPEMRACISAPFVFLLTDEKGTQNCGGNEDLPSGYHEAYAKVQALTQASISNSDPFVFNKGRIAASPDEETQNIYARLDGGAFRSIFVIHGLRLSVGILKSTDPQEELPEDPVKLARILSSYLAPAIIEHLLRIATLLAESRTKRETLLQYTSRSCRWVGEEQLAILEDSLGESDMDSINECFQKFKTLSGDLRVTGEFLSTLASETNQQIDEVTPQAAETIEDVWQEVKEQFDTEGIEFEGPSGDFSLPLAKADLFLSALRVLQWMALRKNRMITGSQKISVAYAEEGDFAKLIFTDQSRRLSKNLRERLFEPFAQTDSSQSHIKETKEQEESPHAGLFLPLFLARMLVEVKYKGSLHDRTDDLETPNGHRFVMRFPLQGKSSVREGAIATTQLGLTG